VRSLEFPTARLSQPVALRAMSFIFRGEDRHSAAAHIGPFTKSRYRILFSLDFRGNRWVTRPCAGPAARHRVSLRINIGTAERFRRSYAP